MQTLLQTILLGARNLGLVGEVIVVILFAFTISFALAFVFWLFHSRSIKKRYR